MKFSKRSLKLENETAFEVLSKALYLKSQGKEIINLGIGQPDFLPPKNVIKAGIEALKSDNHGYSPSKGLLTLRELISNEVLKRYNSKINPENILITPGGKVVIYITIMMLVEKGSEVILPDPGFPIYRSATLHAGANPVSIKLNEKNNFSFIAEDILRKINKKTRLIIINSPSNPTGTMISLKELNKLVDGLVNYPEVHILSDEIYSKILFNNNVHRSLIEFPNLKKRVIILDGLSKSFAMTGWRIGWGIFPESMIDIAETYATNIFSCVNYSTQVAAIEAIKGSQKSVELMNSIFEKRSNLMFEGLNSIKNFTCIKPQGAFYCFPNISKTKLTSNIVQNKLLEEVGVATIAGSSFGKYGNSYIRISCAASEKDLNNALNKINDWSVKLPKI